MTKAGPKQADAGAKSDKNRTAQIIIKRCSDLIPAEYNPRQLTKKQYADLRESLTRFGCGVILCAHHTCMGSRGVVQPDAQFITSAVRGAIESDSKAREEFLSAARPWLQN